MDSNPEQFHRDDGSWITHEFLQKILQEDEPSQKILVTNKDVTFALGKAENYLSNVFRVEVQYKRESNESIEKRHLIVKGLPDGEMAQRMVSERGFFEREFNVYHSVLPAIHNFTEKLLQNNPIPSLYAKYYQSFRCNTIVLEDMTYEGFKMANRKELLDLQHCKLVVRNLARFHGMSATFHRHNPDILPKYEELNYCEAHRQGREEMLRPFMNNLIKQVRSWPGFEIYVTKMEKLNLGIVDKIINLAKFQVNGFNVLRHGDCWANNYMFKYSPTGEPEDVRFVDFQFSAFGSPAMDLSYFLFSSPKNEVRMNNMEQLLLEYHSKLSETLSSLGCNSDMFTFDDLKNEMKKFACYGYVTACTLLHIVLADADDIPDFAEIKKEDFENGGREAMMEKMHRNSRIKKVFQEIIPFFDKQGMFE